MVGQRWHFVISPTIFSVTTAELSGIILPTAVELQCPESFNGITSSINACSDDNFLLDSSSFISQATMCILSVTV